MSRIKFLLHAAVVLLSLWSTALQAQSPPVLNVELVNERITELNALETVDEETKSTYQQAATFLNQADAHSREADVYVQALTTAPAQRAVIQSRLDKLEDTYDPAAQLVGFSEEELTARLALAQSEQSELTTKLETMDRTLAARETNTSTIQARIDEIGQRLSELPDVGLAINANAQPSLVEASQMRNAAEVQSLQAERRALEARLASQPARYSAMTAGRAELSINLERTQALIAELESRVSDQVNAVVDPAELDIAPDDPAIDVAISFTTDDALLRDQRLKVNQQLQQVREQNQVIERLARAVDERFATARRVVEFAAGSDALGQVLLTYWEELSDFSIPDPTSGLSQLAGNAVIQRITHEEALNKLISASTYISAQLRSNGIDPESVPVSTRSQLLDLARGYRERLRGIITAESEYIEALGKLGTSHDELVTKVEAYRDYLESMLLWIPNHPPLWLLTPDALIADFNFINSRVDAMSFQPGLLLFCAALLALALLLIRPRLIAQQLKLNEKISRPRDDSIRHTVYALVCSMLRAMPIPVLLLGIATGFNPQVSSENALMNMLFNKFPFVVFVFGLLCIICEPAGIGRLHFGWPKETMQRLHRLLLLLMRWWLPLLFATTLAHRLTPVSGDEALGRLMILLVLIVLGYNIGSSQVREIRSQGSAWFSSTLNRFRLLFSSVLVLALIAIIQGLAFSVVVVIGILINTLWIGTFLLLTHSVLIRWLRVARRHLRLAELLAQRQEHSEEEGDIIDEKLPDLGDISADTQQLITSLTWVGAAVALYYIWAPLLPAFDGLSRITLWTSTSEVDGQAIVNQISMTTLLVVMALATFTIFAAKRLPALIEIILRSRTSTTPSARYTISTLLNYVIIAGGTVAGLSALGLQWGQLQWLVAALGVGIGFGLQEIVANFISGLIILFERPIRVGDWITIGDSDGKVIRIRIRATTIQDWDGKELLVPNKDFITGRLLNWTLSDPNTRLTITVGIAYGSDVEEALRILKEVVAAHPQVLDEPPPSIVFLEFGDNSLNLHARFFISRVEDRMPILSSLHVAINKAFNDAGMVIAFPQRDIHFDPDVPLRIAMEPPRSSESRQADET